MGIDLPYSSPVNLTIKPKGYTYEHSNTGDIDDGRDYGVKWSDGGLIGDQMYQYQLITRTNSGAEPNSDNNIATINGSESVALTINGFKNRLELNGYSNNSLIGGVLQNALLVTDTSVILNFPDMETANFTALFTDTSAIFNIRRSLVDAMIII